MIGSDERYIDASQLGAALTGFRNIKCAVGSEFEATRSVQMVSVNGYVLRSSDVDTNDEHRKYCERSFHVRRRQRTQCSIDISAHRRISLNPRFRGNLTPYSETREIRRKTLNSCEA